MKKKKMKITIIIAAILLGLGLWFAYFDTPKMLMWYFLRKISEIKHSSDGKSERKKLNEKTAKININWMDNLDGDFSFKDKWQYSEETFSSIIKAESLYVLGGDDDLIELCKKWETKEKELEENNNITHYPYTLTTSGESEQFDFMLAEQINNNTVECQSSGKTVINGSGIASLNLNIVENVCYPLIGFTKYDTSPFLQRKNLVKQSLFPPPFEIIFPCKGGNITIDKTCWDGGWLKASFSFIFNDLDSGSFTLSGKIFTPIQYKKLNGKPLMEFDDAQYLYYLSLSSKYR